MKKYVLTSLVVALVIIAGFSMKRIEAGEIGVKLNRLSGNTAIIDTQGFTTVIPFVHTLYILDASPQTLTMQGNDVSRDMSTLPRLTVRANDGSNFWFEDENHRGMTIQYQIIPDHADTVLGEVGEWANYREWLLPTVRSLLRDAFGRASTMEVSDPTTYNVSTGEAESMLNEALNPHGIRIINVDTPRPSFSQQYEAAIDTRIETENEITVISGRQERAQNTRARQLAELDQARNSQYQETRARLEGDLARAQSERQRRLTEARADLTRTEGEALSLVDEADSRAEQLTEQWNAMVAQTRARITALEANGQEAVMRAIAEQLENVEISVQPYHTDGAPQTVRLQEQ